MAIWRTSWDGLGLFDLGDREAVCSSRILSGVFSGALQFMLLLHVVVVIKSENWRPFGSRDMGPRVKYGKMGPLECRPGIGEGTVQSAWR